MRYYQIITDGNTWCSVVNGENDPSALDIELDITLAPNGALMSGWVKIYGIPQSLISQVTNFSNQNITIMGGMFPGLPLATKQVIEGHTGQLCQGQILSALGNWIGNELSLEFIIVPGGNAGGPTAVKNIIHNMPQGTTLGSAIQQALTTAFPNISCNVNISNSLVLNYDDKGFYQGLEQYQNYCKALSHDIKGTQQTTGYTGVVFDTSRNNQYNVIDGTVIAGATELYFDDLIGQPAWVDAYSMQVKVVLRGDLGVGTPGGNQQITLPPNILVTSQTNAYQMFIGGSGYSQLNQSGDVLNFQGTFTITGIRHVGKFRQPTGEAWVTIITAVPNLTGGGGLGNQSGQQSFAPGAGAGPGRSPSGPSVAPPDFPTELPPLSDPNAPPWWTPFYNPVPNPPITNQSGQQTFAPSQDQEDPLGSSLTGQFGTPPAGVSP